MKPPPFSLVRAESIDDAVEIIAAGEGGARVLAGGQSLIPMLRARSVRPAQLVDIHAIENLRAITARGSWVDVGAMVTHRALATWAAANGQEMMSEAAGYIGHPAIRSMGTVAGSLAHADPSAEWGAVALALEAKVMVAGPDGRRVVAAGDLFSGPFSTSLDFSEMIVGVRFPYVGGGTGAMFVEVAARRGDPAVAGVAALIRVSRYGKISKAHIGLAGLAPTPVRATSVEAALAGLPFNADLADAVREVGSDISPPSDIHGSDRYRNRVAPVVVERAVRGAIERAVAVQGAP